MKKGISFFVAACSLLLVTGCIKATQNNKVNNPNSVQTYIEHNSDDLLDESFITSKASLTSSKLIVTSSNFNDIVIDFSDLYLFSNLDGQYISGNPKNVGENIISFSVSCLNGAPSVSVQTFDKSGCANNVVASLNKNDFDYLVSKANDKPSLDITFAVEQAKQSYTSTFINSMGGPIKRLPVSGHETKRVYYPDYVDYDGIIKEYKDNYLSEDLSYGRRCENKIVDIVPKELFSTLGDHICIGKEYGFYICCLPDYVAGSKGYVSDVLVFDIETGSPMATNYYHETGYLEIKPLFQYRYRTVLKSENRILFPILYATNSDRIVVTHGDYNCSNYYIANPRLATSIMNVSALNTWDDNYSISNDEGTFFIESIVEGKFCVFCQNPTAFDASKLVQFNKAANIFKTVLGWLDLFPTPLTVITDILGFVVDESLAHYEKDYDRWNTPTDYYLRYTFPNDASEQRDRYSSYIRTIYNAAEFGTSKLLSDRLNCYFRSDYRIANTPNNHKAQRLRHDVGLEIYGVVSASTQGPEMMCNVSTSFTEDYTIYPEYILKESVSSRGLPLYVIKNSKNVTLSSQDDFKIFRIETKFPREYTFKTTGSYGTTLTIYNENYEIVTADDGGLCSNAEVNYCFDKNKIYYLKVAFTGNNNYSSCQFMVEASLNCDEVHVNENYTQDIWFFDCMIVKFIPNSTRMYTIETARAGGEIDPQMYIYDENGVELAYNDDYEDEDSRIDMTLNKNIVYFIHVDLNIPDFYSGHVTLTIR